MLRAWLQSNWAVICTTWTTGLQRGGDVWRRNATFLRPAVASPSDTRGAPRQTGPASLRCITATNRHRDNVKGKKIGEEERQNPGFLSLITRRDANGITKSSTSPACVSARENRCTHYYSRKPIRAAAGQRSSNTVSTRAARISTRRRLSDPRSQVWKFVMTSGDNSTVCTLFFLFVFIRATLQERDACWLQFSDTFSVVILLIHFQAVCKRQSPTLCSRTVWEDVFVTCHNYCSWSGVIL